MDYVIRDPFISCVMSENGKHWNITTHNRPELMRVCYDKSSKNDNRAFCCSLCGKALRIEEEDLGVFYELRFCPHCGAEVIKND